MNMRQHLTLGVLSLFVTFSLFCSSYAEELIPSGRIKDCNKSYDKTILSQVSEVLGNCQKYEVGKKTKFSWWKNVALKKKTDSLQDCHILCLTNVKCLSFVWASTNGMCRLLTKGVDILEDNESYTSGSRDTCIENIDPETKDYFSDPFLWQNAVKASYLEAKGNHNGSIESRRTYSREVHCLKPLLEFGTISEEEMGVAPGLLGGNEVPFLPQEGDERSIPISVDVQITGNSGTQRIPGINPIRYRNWIITGLYAPPGKIITVTSPEIILNKFSIKIGSHKDKLYGKDELNRDPDVTEDFGISNTIQNIGSPYGGLIFVIFPDNTFEGQTFELKFENVLKAPHFILGRDTNEDWNNKIKTEAIPWTVFEVPKKISFVVPSRGERGNEGKGAYQLTDVTLNLNEWSTYMDRNDKAAGIVNRPSAEMVVVDSQIVIGSGHNGYPVMKVGMGAIYRIFAGFPKKTLSIFEPYNNIGVIMGHEIGHNMQLATYMLSHVSCNTIFYYAMPKKRVICEMCRRSQLYSYIKAGKPVTLIAEEGEDTEEEDEINDGSEEDEDNGSEEDEDIGTEYHDETEETKEPANNGLWSVMVRMPLDGLDGSGWGNDGGWDDLPAIYAEYRKLPRTSLSRNQKMDTWVKIFCEVKKKNMLRFFEFWKFFITESTKSICNTFSETPTELISYISHIETMAKEEDACSGLGDGWFGTSKKCFKISEQKFNYAKAVNYCKGLGESTSLASITDVDEAVVINYEILKFGLPKGYRRGGIWIESAGDTSLVFPFAKEYISNPDSHVILGKYKVSCHFGATATAMENEGKCVGPLYEDSDKLKYKALCEKTI